MNEIEKFQIESLKRNIIVSKKIKGDLVKLIAKKIDKQGYATMIETDYENPDTVIKGMEKSIKDLWK